MGYMGYKHRYLGDGSDGESSQLYVFVPGLRRDLRWLARWANGDAQRLNPILRFEQL
jgi:hypothetical protein